MTGELDAFARRALAIQLGITLVTCAFSVGYFHPDEHVQILELASYKLGITRAGELPWEYGRAMRPFLQPAACFAVLRGLRAIGLEDPFTSAAILRVLHALVSLLAVRRLLARTLPRVPEEARRAHVVAMCLAGYLPYLFARTSSENLSGALLALAVAELLGRDDERTPGRMLGAGLALGLAFEARYQTGLASAGIGLWLLVFRRDRPREIAALVVGALPAFALGALADAWGYGRWVFPAVNYVKVNVFEGVAAEFGREPFVAYLYLPIANVFVIPAAVTVLAALIHVARRPRDLLSFAVGVFVLGHSALSHKEERFVFPVAILATAMIAPALAPGAGGGAAARALARLWAARRGPLGKLVVVGSVLPMVFLALYPLGWRSQAQLARYLYREAPEGALVVTRTSARVEDLAFYTQHRWTIERLDAPRCLADVARGRPTYLVVDGPTDRIDEKAWGARGTLVFEDFPLYERSAWVREVVAPQAVAATRAITARTGVTPQIQWHALFAIDPSARCVGEDRK